MGVYFDNLALVDKKTGVLEFHEKVTNGKIGVGRPRHCTDSILKHNSCLPVKMVYLLSLKLQPKGQASHSHTPSSKESSPREGKQGDKIFACSLSFTTA